MAAITAHIVARGAAEAASWYVRTYEVTLASES